MDCRVVLWLFAKPGVWLVRGFIGIYAVLTDRMERPIGQSMRFFIIVLDTVILLAFDQCLLYFIKPITNPGGVKIMSVSFKGDHLFGVWCHYKQGSIFTLYFPALVFMDTF